jgi:histidinol-phosphate aminotransferase
MRAAVEAMKAYTLELREADTKLNQNESPADLPRDLKQRILEAALEKPWNRYPDFEAAALRQAIARAYDLKAENILVGNGSNELLAATISTFVGPGTPVVMLRPSFALYEKLVTIAGGTPVFADVDPAALFLPDLPIIEGAIVIVASPNNPTGGVLKPGTIESLLARGATVLLDRAYGDFAPDTLLPLNKRLVTFSTFSKAWGIAGLRVGWLATTAETAQQIRKVKLPYSLNVISEAAAAELVSRPDLLEKNVRRAVGERGRLMTALQSVRGVTPFPSSANFIAFRVTNAKEVFEGLCARQILIRDISAYPGLANCLRVSIGTPSENDAFLTALKEIV